jgi:protein required for attachment to host cells
MASQRRGCKPGVVTLDGKARPTCSSKWETVMRVRIVVADQSEARFYDIERPGAPLVLAGRITDPNAHLHDRDFKSDRPGRVFDHAPSGGRRGAVGHHSTGGERTPRVREALLFARRIAAELEQARLKDRFDRVILAAGPPFLGVLRESLTKVFHSRVAAEIPKDLVHAAESDLRAHLPREVFRPPVS